MYWMRPFRPLANFENDNRTILRSTTVLGRLLDEHEPKAWSFGDRAFIPEPRVWMLSDLLDHAQVCIALLHELSALAILLLLVKSNSLVHRQGFIAPAHDLLTTLMPAG